MHKGCEENTVICPSGEPCIVNCNGVDGCAEANIDGSLATNVEVRCTGEVCNN